MEEAVNKLVAETISQPLFLFFAMIGIIGLVYSMIKNVRNYLIHIILFIFIISLVGIVGKKIQIISLIIAIIAILIFGVFFAIIRNKERSQRNSIDKKISYDFSKDSICPKCGAILKERTGKYGKFYGCSNYPNCRFVRKIDLNSNITINVNIADDKNIEDIHIDTDNKCPQCGSKLFLKSGRYGKFYGCSNYPNCRYTKKI